ncbi:MAG: metal-dependent hydrolase [Ruminococcaceae bacterium]|nr:metal-dependent hydrolase [Oscillospiraceae bacterium]
MLSFFFVLWIFYSIFRYFIMMGKTHFTVGLAAALAVASPSTLPDCLTAVIGGCVGGVLADCDILDNDHKLASFSVQFVAAGVTALAMGLDGFLNLGILRSMTERQTAATAGMIAFAVLWLLGVFSGHRTFTHSVTALLLYTFAVYVIHPPLTVGFAAAYLSHLVLDLLNRKNLPLLYPMKSGICFKLFYADGFANRLFFLAGTVTSAYLLTRGILSGFAAIQ